MSAFTTVNNNQEPALQSPPVSHKTDELEEPEMMEHDEDDLIPHHDHVEPKEQLDDTAELPNNRKRKRYNEPPTEIHAELRRPEREGQWYSKSPEQWAELSHLHKLIYSHVGRIEETELGEEVEPCEACRKRGFTCMKYKQDHPEVEKLYKGNVRVGTSCTRCRRYRRTCATTAKNTNGKPQTPRRPQSSRDDITDRGSAYADDWKQRPHEQEKSEMWDDDELLAAVTGSPNLSSEESRDARNHTVQTRTDENDLGIDFGDMDTAVAKLAFLSRVQALESEVKELRAERSEFNKDRRDWKAKKRDLASEIHHLREEKRRSREDNWQLQNKVLQLEKEAMQVKNHDMQHTFMETELKAEIRRLQTSLDVLTAEQKSKKSKFKQLKRENKEMKRRISELQMDCDQRDGDDQSMPPPRKTRHSTVN